MIDLNLTFFVQLVNFLIILAVLNLILLRPIRGILQQRSDQMSAQLASVERFNSESQRKLSDYEQALNDARREGAQVRDGLKAEGQSEEEGIITRTAQDIEAELEVTRQKIASQSKDAAEQLHQQVDTFARQAAEKILSQT
jgi:F-type H+-transporting ATPase subunit b